MKQKSTHELLSDYDSKHATYKKFTVKMEQILKEVLDAAEGLQIHSVNARVKERSHFEEKISREGKAYTCLEDVTDVSGVRIITYFEEDVQKVADLIESSDTGFVIDPENSPDKSKFNDPERFGYKSRHYVLSLNDDRTKLRENQGFKGLKCEVQIRSVLQHGWAEIEHDFGYKSKESVPLPVRRKFAQAASLIEIADELFNEIRQQIKDYTASIPAQASENPSALLIDVETLRYLVETSPIVAKINDRIRNNGVEISIVGNDNLLYVSGLLKNIRYSSIQEVKEALTTEADTIVLFAKRFTSANTPGIYTTACLVYLMYILIWPRASNEKEFYELTTTEDFDSKEFRRDGETLYQRVKSSYEAISH